MRQTLHRRGLTIVELVMGLGVASLLIAAFTGGAIYFYRGLMQASDDALRIDAQNRILDYLARDVRSASAAKVDQNGTRLTLELPALYEEPGKLAPPLIGSSTQVLYGSGTMQVVYTTADNCFQRTSSGTTQTLASLPVGASVVFSPSVLSGSSLPPFSATVTLIQPRRAGDRAIVARRTFHPQANAGILP